MSRRLLSCPQQGFYANFEVMPRINFNGFSLVELMVAVGIIALVSAVAIPNFKNFSKTEEIDSAASKLMNTLKQAQSSASSRIKCPVGNESTTSWWVNLTTNNYTPGADCTSGARSLPALTYAAAPDAVSTFTATTDRCPGEGIRIYYSGLNMSYRCDSTSGYLTGSVTITLSGGGLNKTIIVEPGGAIR